MDDAIDKINKWRLNPDRYAKEDAVTCIGPETDVEYDGDSRRQHNITHLIRLADEIMSQTPKVHNIIPNVCLNHYHCSNNTHCFMVPNMCSGSLMLIIFKEHWMI